MTDKYVYISFILYGIYFQLGESWIILRFMKYWDYPSDVSTWTK